MALDANLLDYLACPSDDHAPLRYDEAAETLTCTSCGRVYRVEGGIPVLLLDEAQEPAASGR